MNKRFFILLIICLLFTGCRRKTTDGENQNNKSVTEVTVTHIHTGIIQDNLILSGTTFYQRKSVISSPISAFVTAMYIQIGSRVRSGQKLFEIETKERCALNGLDSFSKWGRSIIRARQSGIVMSVNVQTGSYVMEGSLLCTIADTNSMVFNVDVPYEDHRYATSGTRCAIILPDDTRLNAVINSSLISMESASQVQEVVARASAPLLPEGMNVKVEISKKPDGKCRQVLPTFAVQSDEAMKNFWVMKVIGDRAIKVPVMIGRNNRMETEIVSPRFSPSDIIINDGAYALPDGAFIKIVDK